MYSTYLVWHSPDHPISNHTNILLMNKSEPDPEPASEPASIYVQVDYGTNNNRLKALRYYQCIR